MLESRLFALGCATVIALIPTGVSLDHAFAQQPGAGLKRCRAIANETARLHCYESVTTGPGANSTARALPDAGHWRLVRSRDPSGGKDAVSIMQTADVDKSDLDLAGLMLRCGDAGTEVLVILLRPLPPRTHPKITVTAGGQTSEFAATVVPPGAELLLSPDAGALASGPWTNAAELVLQVDTGQGESGANIIRGVVPLVGLSTALPQLVANCPSR